MTRGSNRKGMGAGLRLLALGLAIGAAAAPAMAGGGPTVETAHGPVVGTPEGAVLRFLGIPYATPPVGDLRWRPPLPPENWIDPVEAFAYPPACAQGQGIVGEPSENEDCLYLNVWTPTLEPLEPLPVMVWIHGGSNVSGSTADEAPFPGFEGQKLYDGFTLANERGVVVVTINYRLGVFGFFGHADLAEEAPLYPFAGNQGLLDQRQALLWVRDNIAEFGGDPNKVTIFGESAGSFDVCAHVASPMSAGLFHRAISQSGGCTAGVRSATAAAAAASTVSAELGCDVAPDELECLRAVSVADLLDAANTPAEGSEVDLGISVDGAFLPDLPRNLFDAGEFNKVPYILGANGKEGSIFFLGADPITEMEYLQILDDRYGLFADAIAAQYPASSFPTPLEALVRVMGDSTLVCSTWDTARRISQAKKVKTWHYEFTRVPTGPGFEFIALLNLGAFHGLEIPYVFGSITPPNNSDANLSRQMREYWSNFADRGKPKAKKASGWPVFKAKSAKVLRLNTPLLKLKGFGKPRCEFWTEMYDSLGS